jgi:cytochrome c biogenesis protein CcmG, thiol:disulfide interchange protein DsbE
MTSRETLLGSPVEIPTKGKVTVVDVWSTSCQPCVKSIPSLESLWKEKGSNGLLVVGIAIDDNPGLVVEYVKKMGVSYPIVVDGGGSLQAKLQASVLPQTLVFDRQGRMRWAVRGGTEEEITKLRNAVEVLLSEK